MQKNKNRTFLCSEIKEKKGNTGTCSLLYFA